MLKLLEGGTIGQRPHLVQILEFSAFSTLSVTLVLRALRCLQRPFISIASAESGTLNMSLVEIAHRRGKHGGRALNPSELVRLPELSSRLRSFLDLFNFSFDVV